MRRLKYVWYLLAIVLLTIGSLIAYVLIFLPNVGAPPDITVKITAEKVARGNYLANNVMLCMDCHAERDFTLFTGPPKTETLGAGGEFFDQNIGLPGSFISRNLTPTALNSWTDGEIFRAITTGVSKDGSALFPIMPYLHYGQLDERDIRAVIAYLRTLDPVENELPASKADFPFNILINTMPQKASFQTRPESYDIINYGRYMITAAACTDCHTRMERGKFVGEPFAGGNEFTLPDGSIVRSSNITPHETGIGKWTKEAFINRFKYHSDSLFVPHNVDSGQFQTIMPWMMYAGMTEEDLGAIFEYLQTIPPVENAVELFTPGE